MERPTQPPLQPRVTSQTVLASSPQITDSTYLLQVEATTENNIFDANNKREEILTARNEANIAFKPIESYAVTLVDDDNEIRQQIMSISDELKNWSHLKEYEIITGTFIDVLKSKAAIKKNCLPPQSIFDPDSDPVIKIIMKGRGGIFWGIFLGKHLCV